jgi:dUTP pyrophosphatase
MLDLEFIAQDNDFIPQQLGDNAGRDLRIDLSNTKCATQDYFDLMFRIYGSAYFSGTLDRKYIFDSKSVIIFPGDTHCISLGFKVNLISVYYDELLIPYLEVMSRSGLASKGLIVANAPGVIDVGYLDEVKVLLHNQSNVPHVLKHKDRVAQCMLKFSEKFFSLKVDSFDATSRGGGFGSTGI